MDTFGTILVIVGVWLFVRFVMRKAGMPT